MAKRGKKQDDGMGCLFGMFQILMGLLVMLFTSDDPAAKKVGWGIVGALIVLGILSGAEMSGIGIVITIISLVVIVSIIASKSSSSNANGKCTKQASVEKQEEITENKSFEECLKAMEKQIASVKGNTIPEKPAKAIKKTVDIEKGKEEKKSVDNVNTKEKAKNKAVSSKVEFWNTVNEAVSKYSVPPGYKKIVIEQIQETDIKECPAIIWKDETLLYVLPLLKNAKIYQWPLTNKFIVLYERMIEQEVEQRYEQLFKSPIVDEFSDEVPVYFYSEEYGAYTGKFILSVGLEVTNASAKVLFDMLELDFQVTDEVTQSSLYVEEVKELYQKNILVDNGIISVRDYEEYKKQLLKAYKEREKDSKRYKEQIILASKLGLCSISNI